jgi:ribosome-binding factor A
MVKHRLERISDRIHEEVSDLLLRHVRDPRIDFVTVTGVMVSPDLELATIYVSMLGDAEARQNALKALEGASGYVRRQLAVRLGMRTTPAVRFALDESWERGAKVDALLDRLRDEEPSETSSENKDSPPSARGGAAED